MKRIIAIFMATLMIIALVGCGKQKRKIIELTLSTEDSAAILAAAGIKLPDKEDTPAAGSVIKYFSWGDFVHNYSDDEIIQTGFWTFKNKYDCEVEWVECTWADRFTSLANQVLSGDSPDFYDGYAESFPKYYLSGVFQAVDDYVDYNDPLWSGVKDFADKYFSLGGRHYMFVTDATFNNVCAYNRRVINEWGFDDPAQLFYNDEWTWEKFYEMCLDFSGYDSDRFAIDGWGASGAFLTSCGTMMVTLDPESAKFVSNIDDSRLERAAGYLYDLNKNQCTYPMWERNRSTRNGGADGAGIAEGLCLFWLRGTWTFTGPVDEISPVWGDVANGELMFCPIPRDENGDGNYYVDTKPSGFSLIVGAQNPEGVALYAACCRFKTIDPTVIDIDRKQLKEVYLWTDEMLEMYDTMYELAGSYNTVIDYEYGLGDVANVIGDCTQISLAQNPTTWAQVKEANKDRIDAYLDELNSQIQEFVTGEN